MAGQGQLSKEQDQQNDSVHICSYTQAGGSRTTGCERSRHAEWYERRHFGGSVGDNLSSALYLSDAFRRALFPRNPIYHLSGCIL